MSPFTVVRWFGLLVAALAVPVVAVAGSAPPTEAEVEQAVIAAIPAWHGQKATILRYLDLTAPLHTVTPWALVVAQDPDPPADPNLEEQGPIAICLVKALTPDCTGNYAQRWVGAPAWYFEPYHLVDSMVVSAGRGQSEPLPLVKTCSAHGGDGNCNIQTVLYRYDRQSGSLAKVFVNESGGSNNNQAARFVERGPLQGDEVIDSPTEHAPYEYWIEVYAPHGDGPYRRILRYRSSTHYGDGNPLPVADSEMPNVLRRLGLWKPGDALPVPQPLPANCGRLVMNHGEEWCQNLCFDFGGSACSRIKGTAASASRDR